MLQFLETTTDAVNSTGGGMYTIIMLAVMIGIMYFLMIRPESKRKKEAEAMRSAMKVGDEIEVVYDVGNYVTLHNLLMVYIVDHLYVGAVYLTDDLKCLDR